MRLRTRPPLLTYLLPGAECVILIQFMPRRTICGFDWRGR